MGSDKLLKALDHASLLHAGQKRIGGRPAFMHAVGAMGNLIRHGVDDEDVLVAAVLHDVVEDCKVDPYELSTTYGPRVAEIVKAVSKSVDGEFDLRTWSDFAVKMADRLDNLQDMKLCSLSFRKKQIFKTLEWVRKNHVQMAQANPGLFGELMDTLVILIDDTVDQAIEVGRKSHSV